MGRRRRWVNNNNSKKRVKKGSLRAFGASSLGLPVIVTGAALLVAISPRRHTQTLITTLVAEEETRLLVRRLRAPVHAPRRTVLWVQLAFAYTIHAVIAEWLQSR